MSSPLDSDELAQRARRLRMLLSDVDGVLTDGRLYYGPDGVEIKVFDVKDGLGFALARRAGLLAGILSARGGTAVEQRARELELDEVLLQRRDKSAAFAELLARRALADDEVAYVGDDLTDLPILARAGLSFAPADAALEVRRAAHCTLEAPGGRGALREAVELLLRSRGQWAEVVAAVGRVQGVGASLGR